MSANQRDESRAISLYWWRHRNPSIKNVGDELNPLIVEKVSGRPVKWASLEECSIVAIGSILEGAAATQRLHPIWVWGSGFIKDGGKLKTRTKTRRLRFAAVRGPLSAKRLARRSRPQALGDPALLADSLQRHSVQTSWEIGVVPHYVDLAHPLVSKLQDLHDEIIVISPLLPPEEFVENIASCRTVISSSLHGLVVADSVGVPNIWVKFSEQVLGKGYKYRDYLANFGIVNPTPQYLTDIGDIDSTLTRYILSHYRRPGIEQMKEDLVAAFPQI